MFFKDGTAKQVMVGEFVAIGALVLYGGIGPFLDDSADRLATFAQLSTFMTLHIAFLLLVAWDEIVSLLPGSLLGSCMVILNISVVVYNAFTSVWEAFMGDEEFELPEMEMDDDGDGGGFSGDGEDSGGGEAWDGGWFSGDGEDSGGGEASVHNDSMHGGDQRSSRLGSSTSSGAGSGGAGSGGAGSGVGEGEGAPEDVLFGELEA